MVELANEGQQIQCKCGRLWQLARLTQPYPGGSLRCRCSAQLGSDPGGRFGAELIHPRERFVPLRRLAFKLVLPLYSLTLATPVELARWLPWHRIVHLRSPNRAMMTRVECHTGFTMGRIKPRRLQNFWKVTVQVWRPDDRLSRR